MTHGGADGVLFTGISGFLKAEPASILEETISNGEVRLTKADNPMGNRLECVRTRKDPISTAEIGCRSVTVCHLGNLAYWHKQPLRGDPAKLRVLEDAEANTWLDRPARSPWKLEA